VAETPEVISQIIEQTLEHSKSNFDRQAKDLLGEYKGDKMKGGKRKDRVNIHGGIGGAMAPTCNCNKNVWPRPKCCSNLPGGRFSKNPAIEQLTPFQKNSINFDGQEFSMATINPEPVEMSKAPEFRQKVWDDSFVNNESYGGKNDLSKTDPLFHDDDMTVIGSNENKDYDPTYVSYHMESNNVWLGGANGNVKQWLIKDKKIAHDYQNITPGNVTVIKTTPNKQQIFIGDNLGNMAHLFAFNPMLNTGIYGANVPQVIIRAPHNGLIQNGEVTDICTLVDSNTIIVGGSNGTCL
jgi:hypothetical protein